MTRDSLFSRLASALAADAKISWRALRVRFVNSDLFPRSLRARAWRALGLDIDRSALINAGAFLGATTGLTVGPHTFINNDCFFDLAALTEIGAFCDIGYGVMFVTATHDHGDAVRRAGANIARPIVIGDGVWVGARATILPGVRVGKGCVIGAGAVVVADCDDNGLYVGAPARRVRDLV